MNAIFALFELLLNIAFWIIIIQVVLSWLITFNIINLYQPIVRQIWDGLNKITAPIYNPIRKLLPDMGGIDLAPMLVLIAIFVLRTFVQQDLRPMLG